MRKVTSMVAVAVAIVVCAFMLGCSSPQAAGPASSGAASSSATASPSAPANAIGDGRYDAKFNTDSSMFHVNEADDGMGVLTVEGGDMSIHVRLVSKKIVNLYPGTADQAAQDSANVIDPDPETVTYSDGYEEEVYAFDVPVPALDEEFDIAILGEKGTWYDHKVSVTDPEPQE